MTTLSRRSFLKKTSLLAVGAALIPASALGLDGNVAASERITMGLIGCGNHGRTWNLPLMIDNPLQQVIAVCDVDTRRAAACKKKAEDAYSEKMGKDYKGCTAYGDFRDVVNRKDVDAVCIATPDHWHVLMAVFAMKAGKDVISEKPTLTIEQGRILSDTQKKTQRVYQDASENRSIPCYQYIVNAVRNGHIGELQHIKVGLPEGNNMDRDPSKQDGQGLDFNVSTPPKELNYDLWLGPAPVKPFVQARLNHSWRWNLDYSGGVLSDWGSHMNGIAQWANNSDDTSPVEIQGTGAFPDFNEVWNTTPTFDINLRYASGVTMRVWTEVPLIKLEGTKGWLLVRGWRGQVTASDEKLLGLKFEGEKNFARPESVAKSNSGGEHVDFSLCVKSRRLCYNPAETGHRVHTIAHTSNISMLLGGAKLHWNPQIEMFVGERADEANKHFCRTRAQREPWTFANVDSWINVG